MPKLPVDVRAMHGSVASGAPAGAAAHKRCVRNVANENLSAERRNLRVTLQAEIVVALHEHLVRDRTVRLMTDGATFAQRLMVIDHWARLLAMAFGAAFIQVRHADRRPHAKRSAMRGFHDVCAVGIVALHAIHAPFEDLMVLRQFELRVNLHVTRETGLRITPGVHD